MTDHFFKKKKTRKTVGPWEVFGLKTLCDTSTRDETPRDRRAPHPECLQGLDPAAWGGRFNGVCRSANVASFPWCHNCAFGGQLTQVHQRLGPNGPALDTIMGWTSLATRKSLSCTGQPLLSFARRDAHSPREIRRCTCTFGILPPRGNLWSDSRGNTKNCFQMRVAHEMVSSTSTNAWLTGELPA